MDMSAAIEIHLNEQKANHKKIKTSLKYKGFPIQSGNKIPFEENLLSQYNDLGKVESSDITLQEGVLQDQKEIHLTIIHATEIDFPVPDFALEPEGLWSKLFEGFRVKT